MVKELFLCLLSAGLLVSSFPRLDFWPLAWIGFVPLFLALQNKSASGAFFLACFTGALFWLGTIYWLVHVTLPGMLVLVLYLSLYFGIFGLLIRRDLLTANYSLLAIPSLWVVLEYLRSHLFTGFPWALLGYSQYLNLPLIQISDITGVWGVSFLVMLGNISFYYLLRGRARQIIFPVLLFIVVLVYGLLRATQIEGAKAEGRIRISVIQGNIAQELKWDPANNDPILNRYLSLTREAARGKPDLIIWPEASLPVVLEEAPGYYEKVRAFVAGMNIPLLFGAVTLRDGLYYNSALLVSGGDGPCWRYDKLHLVPFGEYIPLRKAFAFLETIVPIGDIAAGREYTVFPSPAGFSVLVCFEDLFPGLSRRFIRGGARFLVNITNDAWFKKTSSPYQHLSASVFRAVENRVYLVRAANTGISGFISPSGRVISAVGDKKGRDIFITGYETAEILVYQNKPGFYTRYGDVFVALFFFLMLYGISRKAKV